ncbi:MAG: sigma-54 dependent transcriptional regulator [Gammaproteobacteria bacterium]|nr:sigma-54 dependent transcriptional regulator [Gammaproteobacteria bacterium]
MNERAILVVEDDAALRTALADTLETVGHRVITAGDGVAALAELDKHDIGIVVSDVQMEPMGGHELLRKVRLARPDLPFVLITAFGTIQKAVTAMRDGATDYLIKPFEADVLVDMIDQFRLEINDDDDDIVAADPKSVEILEMAGRVAASEATVLLSGESGTGKEIYARYMHKMSSRANGPFVAINCAAIPDNMLEAVLFGHEKGAFTGAVTSHAGKFEQAQKGTLLLDEISEMDLALQAKLLRVLQEREVERVGGKAQIALDVRVLATTNCDLAAEVGEGRFREDLYYRLNVFPITLPPLRERTGDVLPLAHKLLQRHCSGARVVPTIDAQAGELLVQHRWPGNVRELDNLLQRTLILLRGDVIEAVDLHFGASRPTTVIADDADDSDNSPLQNQLRDREHRLILDAIRTGGSRKAAAELLGISPRTLRYKLARLREAGIEIPARVGAQIACS